MTSKSIFESEYAIRLARSIASNRTIMSPTDIFGRLLGFAVAGVVSLVASLGAAGLYIGGVYSDENLNTLLLVISFVSGLVLVSTLATSVAFLWDAFIHTYIALLARKSHDAGKEV